MVKARLTPASDKDLGYSDKGQLGTYQTTPGDFPDPEGLKRFEGYGADKDDLSRGYVVPTIGENPVYDLENHKYKWTEPREFDEDDKIQGAVESSFEFRMKDRKTKGFCMRPHLPTER